MKIMATATSVCSLDNYLVLPDHTMDERIAAARKELGRDVVILGHHYQRDEVIRFADFTEILTSFRRKPPRLPASTSFFAACTSWRRAPTCSAVRDR